MIWQRKTIELEDCTDHLVGCKDSTIWTQNHGEHFIHISAHALIGYYSSAIKRMAFMNCKTIKKGI